jgi:hypothetical protein
MNQIPLISWKGKTFNQITSKIQLNHRIEISSNNLYFKALPLQIHRREIVTSESDVCDTRLSSSIDLLNRPNGSIINSKAQNNHNGLENTLDINLTENKTERFDCNTPTQCFNPAKNALRRLRSGGMIKRQYDVSKNNDTYSTSTNQYLISRNRTFQQNQYNYIKKGDAMVIPGDGLSKQNIYAGNGINHCQKYYLPVDTSFQYQWFESYDEVTSVENNDGNQSTVTTHYGPQTYTVDLSGGYYSVGDINDRFKYVMSMNCHYLVSTANKSKLFFMNFAYNTFSDKVELQIQNISDYIFSAANYILPLKNDVDERVTNWSVPNNISLTPVVIINDNIFKTVIGFEESRYPNYVLTDDTITEDSTTLYDSLRQYDVEKTALIQAGYYTVDGDTRTPITDISSYNGTPPQEPNLYEYQIAIIPSTINIFSSTTTPEIKPLYTPLYYKPNNPKFAQQGGVSSSSLVCRKKYDTITNNTEIYRTAYGLQVANAMAYGVPANGYTIKDKLGYPMTKTPVFSKYSDEVKTCTSKTFNG